MVIKKINTENPNYHWEFIDCKDKIVLDLGCGRWEKIEYRDPNWPTTPEYFIQKGATTVYALDSDSEEIDWYTKNVSNIINVIPVFGYIRNTQDIRFILNKYKPNTVKCDIEGFEEALLHLTDEEFSSVEFYALETHSENLYNQFMRKFEALNYKIVAVVVLTHAQSLKVIFAHK